MCTESQSHPFNSLRILWLHCVTKPFEFRILLQLPPPCHFHERQFRPSTHTHTPTLSSSALTPPPPMNRNQFWFLRRYFSFIRSFVHLILLSILMLLHSGISIVIKQYKCSACHDIWSEWAKMCEWMSVWDGKKRKKIVKWAKLGKIDASAKEEKRKSKKV